MKHFNLKNLLVLLLLIPIFSNLSAQQTAHKIVVEEMNYLLYLPDDYDADTLKKWPLMVFLHGAGESGSDVDKVKAHGPAKLIEQGKKYPFIVVSPQSARGGWNPFYVQMLIKKIMDTHRVDEDRVYLTGLSMGGFGTWNTAQAYPEMFAAIAPICGGGNAQHTWSLKNTPIWCFHGDADNVVPISYSQNMIDSLKPYNSNVKFTVYPGVAHDSWTETYNNEELYDWMLSHTRFKYKEVPMKAELRNQYAGVYVADRDKSDTIKVVANANMLEVWAGEVKRISVVPASETIFFVQPDLYQHIVVDIDNKEVQGFTLYSTRDKRAYKKVE